jgi:hydroxyacylglutathione hydrolase
MAERYKGIQIIGGLDDKIPGVTTEVKHLDKLTFGKL